MNRHIGIGLSLFGTAGRKSPLRVEADRNSFSFSAPKMGYLVIFVLFFVLKMSFALGQKCYVRN